MGEHNGEFQGKGESDQSRKRKSDQSRGEDDPMEAGAAPGAHIDTHDLGIANPPTPAPTEANAGTSTIPSDEHIRAMQFVSRVYFNGNPSVFEDTEVVLAQNAVAVFLPESDSRFPVVFTHVVSRVAQMIGRLVALKFFFISVLPQIRDDLISMSPSRSDTGATILVGT